MAWVAVLAALATALVAGVTLAAWDACDVGPRPANLLTVAVVAPGAFLVPLGLGAGVRQAVPGRPLSAVLLVLLLAGFVVLALVFAATPATYPAPVCPANVPPWWPDWLPA
jgi:hypothetical protein